MNRHRGLLVGALVLCAWPISAEAQPSSRIPRIGIISAGSWPNPLTAAFLKGLGELGWVEGQSIAIEYRWAEGRPDRYPVFAAELVRLKVDLIVAGGGERGAQAAKLATSTIPIVAPVTADPVGAGLVASLARPGGNVTGLSMQNTELSAKRLELLKEAFPKVTRVAVIHDPGAGMEQVRTTEAAGRSLGLKLNVLKVDRPEDFEDAFKAAKRERADALVILASSVLNTHRRRLVDLAAKHRLVAVYEHRLFSDDGGLMSYGPDLQDMNRRAAIYVDKILRGAKPADLPIEQPTKFELVINLKTAKALGLTLPQSVLGRADEIIHQ